MKDLLGKLSSYDIFNNLFPGVVFVVAAKATTSFDLTQPDLLLGAFLYYFIGMVVSRVGSLLVEPLLKRVKFVRFADYGKFIEASAKDEKIELLSEVNNTYRTVCSLFLLLALLKAYEAWEQVWPALSRNRPWVLVVALLIIFLAAYRKQTDYVRKRVEKGSA